MSKEFDDFIKSVNEQPLVTHEAICRKRWEDWEEFNKRANYPEDCASPFADGFTRGAKWVLEQIKNNKK